MPSEKSLYNRMFSHVYVEEKLRGDSAASSILDKLPDATVIWINHYKDVFNRPGQSGSTQAMSKKLILARNTGSLVYPGSPYCHDFGHRRFYYTTQVINCPYDCSYCYLKGKYSSANIVAFTNTADHFMEIDRVAGRDGAFVSLSYDSDTAALEPLLGLAGEWLEYIRSRPRIEFEIRTKSLFRPLHSPLPNLVYSISVLPQEIIDMYEKGTPSLRARLESASGIMEGGHRVRLCIDPLLECGDPEKLFGSFVEYMSGLINLENADGFSVGCFRMPAAYYRNMTAGYGRHFIHHYPFEIRRKQARYDKVMEARLIGSVVEPLSAITGSERIFTG